MKYRKCKILYTCGKLDLGEICDFHQWGTDYEEGETGYANYSVAIVEKANGEIETIVPSQIQFIEDDKD